MSDEPIRCRIAATPAGRGGWDFYIVNEGTETLDRLVLEQVGYEWGDEENVRPVYARQKGLAPGGHAHIWSDDDSAAEVNIDFWVLAQTVDRELPLLFEFPKLYRKKEEDLPLVGWLGKRGYVVGGGACGPIRPRTPSRTAALLRRVIGPLLGLVRRQPPATTPGP